MIQPRQHGFTLIEVTLSAGVAAVVMGGIASAVVIAARAMPNPDSGLQKTVSAYHVAEQIASELYCAKTFTERTATAIEFTVADRNNDSSPETIRYAWSGTTGDPLTREYNGGTAVSVASDVNEFDLSYVTSSATTTEENVETVVSAETVLASFQGWPSVPVPVIANTPVNASYWAAEFLLPPPLPPGATEFTVTRVSLRMMQGTLGGAGAFSVGIYPSIGGGSPEPAQISLGTPAVGSGVFLTPFASWAQFSFSDVSITDPSAGCVIVVKGTAGAGLDAYMEYYYNKDAPTNDPIGVWTEDGGASWDPRANERNRYDFPFLLYGTYETTDTVSQDITTYWLQSVGITLRAGSNTSARVNTAVEILNRPEVPAI